MGKFAVSARGETHEDQVFAFCISLDNVGGAECVSGNCLKKRNQPCKDEVQNPLLNSYLYQRLLALLKQGTSAVFPHLVFQCSFVQLSFSHI